MVLEIFIRFLGRNVLLGSFELPNTKWKIYSYKEKAKGMNYFA